MGFSTEKYGFFFHIDFKRLQALNTFQLFCVEWKFMVNFGVFVADQPQTTDKI